MANTIKKEVTTKKTTSKPTGVKKNIAAKKTTTASKKPTASKTVKAVKKEFAGTADLFILNGNKRLDSKHQFNENLSPLYGVMEYVWEGELKPGEVALVRKSQSKVPTGDTYNSGITLVGNAIAFFKVENALTTVSEECSDQVFNYCNPESKLVYIGEAGHHTVYVRVYDNANGTNNDRWATISIE